MSLPRSFSRVNRPPTSGFKYNSISFVIFRASMLSRPMLNTYETVEQNSINTVNVSRTGQPLINTSLVAKNHGQEPVALLAKS